MGLPSSPEKITNKKAAGVTELTIDAPIAFYEPLEEKLFIRHKMLFKGGKEIEIGAWRTH